MATSVGILGMAHGHVERYLEEWHGHPELGILPLKCWDHNSKRMEEAAARHHLRTCDSAEELVAGGEVEAVVIAAETAMHAELVELAARAGKTIVVQKPLALTPEQADRIVRAVKDSGVPFTVAWQMRVDPQNIQMEEMIRNQTFGKVLRVRRRHALSTHTWNGFENTWHNDPTLNRDIWADDAAHPIDWIHSLFGTPDSVTAEIATLFNPRVPNDNGIAIFRYHNGPIVEVSCSFTCVAAISTTEIICERGTIIQDYGDAPSCSVPRLGSNLGLKWYSTDTGSWTYSDIPSPQNQAERIRALAKPLADFIQGKRNPICTAEEARQSLLILLATYRASEEGRRIGRDEFAGE